MIPKSVGELRNLKHTGFNSLVARLSVKFAGELQRPATSVALVAAIAIRVPPALAVQTVVFADRPAGFLTVQTGTRLVMAPAATLQALRSAGAGGRRAEASLLGSIAAGETPLAELHPASVAAIVRTVRQAGEDHAARLFAIETAIAYGL
jgi:hypothetical protein